jgi:hypothetical protein
MFRARAFTMTDFEAFRTRSQSLNGRFRERIVQIGSQCGTMTDTNGSS